MSEPEVSFKSEREMSCLITILAQLDPAHDSKHWRIEIMHRNKNMTLGEDGYTN